MQSFNICEIAAGFSQGAPTDLKPQRLKLPLTRKSPIAAPWQMFSRLHKYAFKTAAQPFTEEEKHTLRSEDAHRTAGCAAAALHLQVSRSRLQPSFMSSPVEGAPTVVVAAAGSTGSGAPPEVAPKEILKISGCALENRHQSHWEHSHLPQSVVGWSISTRPDLNQWHSYRGGSCHTFPKVCWARPSPQNRI